MDNSSDLASLSESELKILRRAQMLLGLNGWKATAANVGRIADKLDPALDLEPSEATS